MIGCNGLLGQNLLQTAPDGADIFGIGSGETAIIADKVREYRRLDITQFESLQQTVRRLAPDLIVNAAAMTHVDQCEEKPQLCQAVNCDAVKTLAGLGIPLVHISTDYVFDGQAGPYREEDEVAPLSVYGRTKLASEIAVLSAHPKNLVVRTMLLWGKGRGAKTQFPEFIRGSLQAGKRIRIVTDQLGNPTLAIDLALALWALTGRECSGLYHGAGPDCISRLAWAEAITGFYALDKGLIDTCLTAELGQSARRPLQSGLISEKLYRDCGFRFRGVQDQLLWFQSHS